MATDTLTPPTPAAPGLPPGYDPNTGTMPAKSTAVAPASATGYTGGAGGDWTDPSAVERFVTNATDAISQGIQGAIGMGKEILNPPGPTEKAKIAHIAKTLILDPMAKQELEARTAKTPWESIGHSIAEAIPMAGPWAADVAEKTGTQAGSGDWAGAAGTVAGNALISEAIEHLSPAAETKSVGAVEPLEALALPEGNVFGVKGRVVDEGKPHPIAAPAEGKVSNKEQPAGKLDDLGTRLPDLQTAEMRNPNVTFGRTGGPFGRAVDVTHQVLRQNEVEANTPAIEPTIEHREVSAYGSGSEAPQPMQQVRLQQNGKTIGRVNYVIDPDTNIASVKVQSIDDPNLRGKGYEQQMVLAAADQARARGATALTSDLQGTTSMDAARVWDKLAAKGHPVEKIPSKAGSPGYTMDLTKPSPDPKFAQALSERGELPGQNVQLGDLGAKYVGRETPEIKTPEVAPAYHPTLQKIAEKYGTSTDSSPLKGPASGMSQGAFIAPDGKFIHLPAGVEHPDAMMEAGYNESPEQKARQGSLVQRAMQPNFIEDTGAIRVRMSRDKAGLTAHISVPKQGITDEQIPAVKQAIAAAGRNGNLVLERSDVDMNNKDQLTMSKDFPRPGDADDYLRRIQAHPDQHPESDLMTNERQSPLREPYAVEIRNPDGTMHTELVDAFSSKDALKTAQKKFSDAAEWASVQPGTRTPSAEYSVPTEKLLSTPPRMDKATRDFYGVSKEDAAKEDAALTLRTMYHELGGHGMIGLKEGMKTKGVVRHTHPDVPSDTRAAVSWDASDLYQPGTRRLKPDKVDAVVKNFMGGPAADEVFSGVPRATNHNFDYTRRSSDGYQAYHALIDAGYTHDDALARMHEMVDENKEYLQKPEVSDVIKENVGVREPGLSTQYHHSPERMQNMHAEIQRRIKANGANTKDVNNGAAGGGSPQDHPVVVARGEGPVSKTTGQVPGEVAKTPAAETTPEVNPHNLVERAQQTLAAGDKKTAASLLAQFLLTTQ